MRNIGVIRFTYRLTLLILTIAAVFNPRPVFADAAPPPPPLGSNPMQDSPGTHVQMVAETVLFDLAAPTLANSGRAKVTATFQMHNQGTQDEGMSVRFPLGFTSQGTCYYSQFPPITDLSVWINGAAEGITISKETVTTTTNPPQQISIPCWAHFPVSFPAGKVVILQVQYTAQGYAWKDMGGPGDESWGFGGDNPSAMLSYGYVLETGAGWYGPIGSVDFTLRLPYEINQQNVALADLGRSWKTSGNELRRHDINFEPDGNIQIDLVTPAVWQTILRDNQAIQADPHNWQTWASLATAYKQAIWSRRGFRTDAGGTEMYTLSDQAYHKAVALFPKDAELHFGYAQLVCWHAQWGFAGDAQFTNPDWDLCLQQLQATLKINPQYARANLALKTIDRVFPASIDLGGPQPDFLLLTPHPSQTPEATGTLLPTPLPPAATATIQITPTVQISTTTLVPSQPVVIQTATVPVTPVSGSFSGYGAVGLALVIVLIGVEIWTNKRMRPR